MSTEYDSVFYEIALNGLYAQAIGTFTAADNWTDEFALTLATLLNGLSLPEGNSFYVTKVVRTDVNYNPNYAANPVSFN